MELWTGYSLTFGASGRTFVTLAGKSVMDSKAEHLDYSFLPIAASTAYLDLIADA
jgi:hypothetical protein